MTARKTEADAFYATVIPATSPRRRRWSPGRRSPGCSGASSSSTTTSSAGSTGDPGQPPPPPGRGAIRNGDWRHLNNHEVILMPDPWEYPWFAAWDLAFHCVTLAHIDPAFAKAQLVLLLREWYMHPNGQIPAYEWNFSDVNPPVHAWAAHPGLRARRRDRLHFPGPDLPQAADQLHLVGGQQGPRRATTCSRAGSWGWTTSPRSTGPRCRPSQGYLEQADSTAWMAMYALDLLDMALRLAAHDIVLRGRGHQVCQRSR